MGTLKSSEDGHMVWIVHGCAGNIGVQALSDTEKNPQTGLIFHRCLDVVIEIYGNVFVPTGK